MLLRSISKHVKDQNWFAVFLDFFIVVAGILIAFQVTNWNEGRVKHKLSQDYINRLIADLQEDLVTTQAVYDYFGEVLENIEEADRLMSVSDADPKALIVASYRASEYNSVPTNRATWEQIVSLGHVDLLPKAAIGSGVSDYYEYQYQGTFVASRIIDSPYRHAVRSVIPLPVQLSIRKNCSDVMNDINNATGFVSDCNLNVDASILNETAQQLQSSTVVRENLRTQYSLIAFVQINNEGNIVLLDRVIKALQESKAS